MAGRNQTECAHCGTTRETVELTGGMIDDDMTIYCCEADLAETVDAR